MWLGWLACIWVLRLPQLKEVSNVAGLACLYLGAKVFRERCLAWLGWLACTWDLRLSQLKEVSSVAGLACRYL